MQETQLACPHCGSTLTFGTQITAGTPVECLICMRTFAAEPLPQPPQPVAIAPPQKEAPPVAVAVPSPSTAVTPKASPKPPPPVGKKSSPAAPSAPRIRRPQESSGMGGRIALVAITCGLFLVLAVGGAVVIWRIATAAQDLGNSVDDPSFAVGPAKTDPLKDVTQINNKIIVPEKKVKDPIDEDDETLKIKAAEKKLLVRKTPAAGNPPEIDWTPVNIKEKTPVYAGLSQKNIDGAIEKGVAYLRKTQMGTGTWGESHGVGCAALGGLTLLECNVPAKDLSVQRAAHYVRMNLQNLNMTYELSLAILFLERLGEARDRPIIQGLALRLLAGQNDCGGWTYECPKLNPQEMYQLFAFLHSNRQPALLNPVNGGAERMPAGVFNPNPGETPKSNDPFQQFGALMSKGFDNVAQEKNNPAVPQKKTIPLRPDWLKANLQNIPVVKNQGKGKGKQRLALGASAGDNSNTQFALLALWAARRHDIPSEQAIMAAYERFNTSQNHDGGWSYSFNSPGTTDSMTCVGLLGLAMGHGTAPDVISFDPKKPQNSIVRPALEDPKIKAGLERMASRIGQPIVAGKLNGLGIQNLYWMWSIERVAMLYDLHKINGKEWYPWGAQILIQCQDQAGHWPNAGHYPGATPQINSCFALLFLKRSNLVQDLTQNLRLFTGIRDPEK
jgi:hypothetical protein